MFSITMLYNSACSYSVIPIRIYPIMMSIVFHHYKTFSLNKSSFKFVTMMRIKKMTIIHNSIILKKELDKWKTYSDILRKPNRDLFNQMLQSSYKYSNAIDAKGDNYSTESLIMSLLFEQYKIIIKNLEFY